MANIEYHEKNNHFHVRALPGAALGSHLLWSCGLSIHLKNQTAKEGTPKAEYSHLQESEFQWLLVSWTVKK